MSIVDCISYVCASYNSIYFSFFEVTIRIIISKEFNYIDNIIFIIISKKGNNNILSKFGGFDR